MTFSVIKKKLHSLPNIAVKEISDYIDYIYTKYNKEDNKTESTYDELLQYQGSIKSDIEGKKEYLEYLDERY